MSKKARLNEYGEFYGVMCGNFAGKVGAQRAAEMATELIMLATQAQRYNLLACNGDLTDLQERRAHTIDQRACDLAVELGTTVRTCGDPRGYALKIILPSGAYNTWGGAAHGWGVPS